MRIVAVALAVVVCLGLTTRAADDEKYASKDGKFKIQFPVGSKAPVATKEKPKDNEMHVTKADAGDGKMCAVIYMDIKDLKPEQADALFDSAVKAAKNQPNNNLSGDKPVKLGDLTGREFVIDLPDGRKMKTRMFVNAPRVYTIVIGGPKDFAISEPATKAFDSFEITK
jgi:hypothetical protein